MGKLACPPDSLVICILTVSVLDIIKDCLPWQLYHIPHSYHSTISSVVAWRMLRSVVGTIHLFALPEITVSVWTLTWKKCKSNSWNGVRGMYLVEVGACLWGVQYHLKAIWNALYKLNWTSYEYRMEFGKNASFLLGRVLVQNISLCQPLLTEVTESQNGRGWKGPLWVI